jgi:glycosyltransferase involved in cell wall biosynthesis
VGERRLRIGFVYDALVPWRTGGAEQRVHELATRLARRHDVHTISWSFWGPEPSIVRDGITHHGVGAPRAFYGDDGKRTVREAAEFAARLLPALRRLRFDVIDCSATPYLPLYATWLTTRASGTPLVATWHEYWGSHWLEYLPNRPVVARVARLLEAGARGLGEQRIAVSAFTAERLAGSKHSAGSNDGVRVVGNGVDVDRIRAAKPDAERSDVIHVGRLIDEKRVDLLLEAIARVRASRPRVRCLIVGDGPERARLEGLVAQLGLAGNVTFTGAVPETRVAALLRASKVLALPSGREGFGIAVVEGQAAGLVPVVANGPFTAAPELVTPGVDGLVCEPTADAFAEATGGLLGDAIQRRELARAALAAGRRQSWDDRAAEMETVFRDLVASPRVERQAVSPVLAEEPKW